MIQAYSRLKKILDERELTITELHRLMQEREIDINIKSLYRLNDTHQPLSRLDLRVAGAICELCEVDLSELVDFSQQGTQLDRLSDENQQRLDTLMEKNNDGKLNKKEQTELKSLVRKTQQITLHNARVLAEQQRRLEDE